MSLTKVNTGLLVVIIAINGYVAFAPLWPMVSFWLGGQAEQRLQQQTQPTQQKVSGPNRLIAPGMQLEAPLNEGPKNRAYAVLEQGVWRLPTGSTPDKGSNTVLLGHRFTYTNPNGVFYHLDKLKPRDRIAVVWEQKRYVYKVRQVVTVKPNQTQIEAPSKESRLTLYTCTPLWLPKDRLVVIADLEEA